MSGFTQVNASEMRDGITSLVKASNDFVQILDALRGKLALSLDSWEGDARTAYTAVQADWNNDAAEMNKMIGAMSTALSRISEGYSNNESSVAKRWTL